MATDLDTLLERCFVARSDGRSVEECFAELTPDARREVEPLVRLADLLRQAPRPTMPATTTAYHEQRLLAHAAQLRGGQQVPARAARRPSRFAFLTNWRLSFVPAATVFLLAMSVILVGGAGAMVSNAGPDDALYNLKLSWEQTQLLVSNNDAQRARVYIGIAQSRIGEIEQLARQGQPIPEELLLQVRLYVNQAILLSASLHTEDAIPILRQLSELLTYERVLLGRFLATLPEPDRPTVELALRTIGESEASVAQALETRVQESLPPATATPVPAATATAQPIATAAPSAETAPLPPAAPTIVLGDRSFLAPAAEPIRDPAVTETAESPTADDSPSDAAADGGESDGSEPSREPEPDMLLNRVSPPGGSEAPAVRRGESQPDRAAPRPPVEPIATPDSDVPAAGDGGGEPEADDSAPGHSEDAPGQSSGNSHDGPPGPPGGDGPPGQADGHGQGNDGTQGQGNGANNGNGGSNGNPGAGSSGGGGDKSDSGDNKNDKDKQSQGDGKKDENQGKEDRDKKEQEPRSAVRAVTDAVSDTISARR